MIKKAAPALLITLMCYLLFLFFSPLYLGTDNVTCAIVVDGLFGPNNYCQYQHPLLCLVVRVLNPLLPSADMFTVVLHLMVAAALFMMAYTGFSLLPQISIRHWVVEDWIHLVILLTTIVFFSAGINLWNNNYTVTAGALVLVGLTLFTLRDGAGDKSAHLARKPQILQIAALFLISLGFMLRKESGLLFLPFIALDALRRSIETKSSCALHRFIPLMIVIATAIITQAAFNTIEPYATAARYNAARTACVDFPMKNWDEGMGVERADYTAATSWVYADTEALDANTLSQIAAAGARDAYSHDWQGLQGVLGEMCKTLFHTDLYMSVLVIITAILAFHNLICSSPWRKLETVLAVLGAFIILSYFTMRGRAPMRVWEPVLFAADWVLLSEQTHSPSPVLPNGETEKQPPKKHGMIEAVSTVSILLIAIVLWFGAGQVIAHSERNAGIQTALTARVDSDDSKFEGTENGLYIWPQWWSTVQHYYSAQGKLPPKEVLQHNIPLGFWVSGQVYFNEMLNTQGTPNPATALLDRSDVFLVEGQEETLLAQMKAHYGEDFRLMEAGTLAEGQKLYRVVREEN